MSNIPKIALLTGASSGIGRWAALGLLKQGYDVIAPVRDPKRGHALLSWLRGEKVAGQLTILSVDMASLASVKAMAAEVARITPRLDLLINNAGMFPRKREVTQEGFERTLAVNHLAPFLLTRTLLPLLKTAEHARIVNVGSSASDRAKTDFSDLQLTSGWSPLRAYGQSKLALMTATFVLADTLQGTRVTANVLNPGPVATRIGDVGGGLGILWTFLKPFLLTPESGAKTSLHVALSPEVDGVTGQYYKRCAPAAANPLARDEQIQARLMEKTMSLLEPFLSEEAVA